MRALAVLGALVCAGGCDALVDPGYTGEAIVTLPASVIGAPPEGGPRGAEGAAALWAQGDGGGLDLVTSLPLRADFPSFWIDVVALPPEEGLFQLGDGEPSIAECYLHLTDDAVTLPGRVGAFLATDYEHALVYVAGPVAPGSITAEYLGGALGPGFHVMIWSATDEVPPAQQVLVDRCVAASAMTAEQAVAICAAQHRYRLDEAARGLDTTWSFWLRAPGA